MLIRKNFYISTDQDNFLSSRSELTVSEHIRRAIDEYIEKLKPKAMASSSKAGDFNG